MMEQFVPIFTEMRHSDVEYDPETEYEYECLTCGSTVSAANHPGDCPDCGSEMRNRRMPYE